MRNSKKIISSVMAASILLSMSACNGGGGGRGEVTTNPDQTTTTTTQEIITVDTDAALQEVVAGKADEYKIEDVESVDKKIQWLSWYPIDETQAAVELFKAQYGIPEEGSTAYGADFANNVFVTTKIAYAERYDKLGAMVASGDSPDIFQFEIGYFPLSAYMNMFQPIDGIVDTTTEDWSKYRSVMDKFMWGGKNWCPIVDITPAYVLFYRRSVCEDAGLTDPKVLYDNGEWTWDEFLKMADTFQKSGDSKFVIDGWNISDYFLGTTGKAMIEIDETGKLKSNLNDPAIERAMNFIETLAKQDYRYPWDLNGYSTNFRAWMNGDTLFFAEGYWAYKESLMQKSIAKYGWADDDVFFVPFPRDPQADANYQLMKQDAYMLVSGAKNIDGYKAWVNCVLQTSKDADIAAANRTKDIRDYNWTEEQLDFLDEMKETITPVWDFKYGVSVECAKDGMNDSPTRLISAKPYTSADQTYAQLRAENESKINSDIDAANAKIN